MKLHFTKEAIADLARLRQFIAEKNPQAAAKVAHDLRSSLQNLTKFPMMGKQVTQAPVPDSIRDLIRGDYIVRYLLQEHDITILRIWHGKEDEHLH